MKVKDGRSARPRFHVYFSIPKMTDSREYTLLKKRIVSSFPYFDSNALDSARLLFGVAEPQVEFYDGSNNIVDYLDDKDFESWDNQQSEIPQGKRNSTMSHYAGRIIKRYGDTDEAYTFSYDQYDQKQYNRCTAAGIIQGVICRRMYQCKRCLIWNVCHKVTAVLCGFCQCPCITACFSVPDLIFS